MIDDAGTITNIHTFSGAFSDGPIGLMQRSDGRLYGTTVNGGEFDLGIVYAIDLDGTFRVVHSFNAGEGAALGIDLVETSDGNLYGVRTCASPRGRRSCKSRSHWASPRTDFP